MLGRKPKEGMRNRNARTESGSGDRIVRGGLPEEVTYEQSPEGSEEVSCAVFGGEQSELVWVSCHLQALE